VTLVAPASAGTLDKWFFEKAIETIEQYVRLATQRLTEPLRICPQQLVARFEKVGLAEPAGK
jgi:hypothetical protein